MTKQEIIEYNKRCAEFLGAELYIPKPWYYFPKYNEHYYFKSRYEPNRFTLKMMKFHSDWNWIMEVVEAIEKLKYLVYIQSNFCLIQEIGSKENNFEPYIVASKYGNTKKEAVVQAINQFLIWYNNEQ